MKRLKNFIDSVKVVVLFVGLYLQKYLEDTLFGPNPPAPWRARAAVLLLLLVLIFMLGKIVEGLIDRWQILRRLILGSNDIEGVWFNKVFLDPPLYGLLRIEIKGTNVNIDGEQFDNTGAMTATWRTDMARFDDRTLHYAYTVTHTPARPLDIRGVSEISFAKASRTGKPIFYNGRFQDTTEDPTPRSFLGFRVDVKDAGSHLSPTGASKDTLWDKLSRWWARLMRDGLLARLDGTKTRSEAVRELIEEADRFSAPAPGRSASLQPPSSANK